ncbi:uncharacterized protein LOC126672682 [Mercurialis annua]|uniref:uncharacterized protein LOC126672682 n=1 Tax=Mercurialis annua TaxID=3986 RepID=UPI002160FADF|nr:uncharacterized protein LOC126672682 [Mercurialis annua]
MGILVKDDSDYNSLLEILSKQLNINLMSTCLEIKYQVKNNYPPMKITDNGNVSFYLELKMNAPDYTIQDKNQQMHQDQHMRLAQQVKKGKEQLSDVINYATFLNNEFTHDEDKVESNFKDDNVITDTRHREIKEGQSYKNKTVLKSVLSSFAIHNHFQFKVRRSCERQYFLSCLDTNCTWKLNATRKGTSQIFIIRKLNINHNCSMVVRTSDQRQATSSVIGGYIKSKYTNLKIVYKPADILRDMRDDHGIKMSYSNAYRSKVVAQEMLRGKPYDSFSLIPSYLYMLVVANPGSFVKLELKDANSFLYIFMALNASIKEWEFCIPVIAFDGTFLTSAYGGMLSTACAQDGNGKIFPLAFSLVDFENDESWEWFMRRIRDAF